MALFIYFLFLFLSSKMLLCSPNQANIQNYLDHLRKNPDLIFSCNDSFTLHNFFYIEQRDNLDSKPITDFIHTLSTPPAWRAQLPSEKLLYDPTQQHNKLLLTVCSEKIDALLGASQDKNAQEISLRYRKIRDQFFEIYREDAFHKSLQDHLWFVPFTILDYYEKERVPASKLYALLNKKQGTIRRINHTHSRWVQLRPLETISNDDNKEEKYLLLLFSRLKNSLGEELFIRLFNQMSQFFQKTIITENNHRFLAYLVVTHKKNICSALIKCSSDEIFSHLLNAPGTGDLAGTSVFTYTAACYNSGWFVQECFNRCHHKELFLKICYPEKKRCFLQSALISNRKNHCLLFLKKALELGVTAEELEQKVAWLDDCYLLRELFIASYKDHHIENLLKILTIYKKKEYDDSSDTPDEQEETISSLMDKITVSPHYKAPEPFDEQRFLKTYYNDSSDSDDSLYSEENSSTENSDQEENENQDELGSSAISIP